MHSTTHLIYVHGRAPKPAPEAFGPMITGALNRGLVRLGRPALPEAFVAGPGAQRTPTADDPWALIRNEVHADEPVKLTIAYYGDLTGRLMVNADIGDDDALARIVSRRRAERNRALLLQRGEAWYDPPGHAAVLEAALEALLAHPEPYSRAQHREMERRHRDFGWVEDALGAIEPARGLAPLRYAVERVIKNRVPDLWGYLRTRVYGSPMRSRLQRVLIRALLDGDSVVLVTHSLGCIVAYDTLWKLSRMSEFEAVRRSTGRVVHWVTLGSPLSSEWVRENLYDADEPESAKLPTVIERSWVNIAAEDDPIAFDGTIEDDYSALSGSIELRDEHIYNPFVAVPRGADRPVLDPHAELGYLAHPAVAEVVAACLGDCGV
ncbi:MAG: hypothetical protein ACTS22_09885 [Phycisphaerales bacterium]